MDDASEMRELGDIAARNGKAADAHLNTIKKVNETVPHYQKIAEENKLLSTLFHSAPQSVRPVNFNEIHANLLATEKSLEENKLQWPTNLIGMSTVSSGTTSLAMNEAAFMLTCFTYKDVNAEVGNWASTYRPKVEALQSQVANIAFVSEKLESLSPKCAGEFRESVSEHRKFMAGTATASGAGILLRNVVEHTKGELIALSQKRGKRGNPPKWQEMAALLGRDQMAIERLATQETAYDKLHGKLSDIAKNRIEPAIEEWESIFSQYSGFLYAVLALAEIGDGK